ncbi:MAG: hypothetical protein ACRENP_09590 [Longimicrobiales bacterium]
MRGFTRFTVAGFILITALPTGCMDMYGPLTGEIQVTVSISGPEPDLDGFIVRTNSGSTRQIQNEPITMTNFVAGRYTLRLEGVAGNCVVAENPRTVAVVAGRTTQLEFAVACSATGTVEVITSTEGEDYPLGYVLSVDGNAGMILPLNGKITTRLVGGTTTIALIGITQNCTIAGGNSRTVSIVVGDTVEIVFASTCTPTRGRVRITTVTTGIDHDPNGYRITLVSQDSVLVVVPANGTVLSPRMAPAVYAVSLRGNSLNCQPAASNPLAVTVVRPDTAMLAFEISCEAVARLAYDEGNFGDLWTINANGAAPSRLLPQPPAARQPRWSPDGRKIAFTSVRDGNMEIYVVDADGSNLTRLTNKPAASHSPAWSPDGQRIAYVESPSNGAAETQAKLFVMNADGTNPVQLTDHAWFDGHPAWSPDGQKIAFTSNRSGNRDIHIMNIDGSGVTRITNNVDAETRPAWSPDGRRLAYVLLGCHGSIPCHQHDRIVLADADGQNATSVTTGDAPAWSPDGRFIAYNATVCNLVDYYDHDYGCYSNGIGFLRANGTLLEAIGQGFNPTWRRSDE